MNNMSVHFHTPKRYQTVGICRKNIPFKRDIELYTANDHDEKDDIIFISTSFIFLHDIIYSYIHTPLYRQSHSICVTDIEGKLTYFNARIIFREI